MPGLSYYAWNIRKDKIEPLVSRNVQPSEGKERRLKHVIIEEVGVSQGSRKVKISPMKSEVETK